MGGKKFGTFSILQVLTLKNFRPFETVTLIKRELLRRINRFTRKTRQSVY